MSVGGTRPEPVDVRVIAATNRDLALETAEGRFREDLYYRLNVVTLTMPPLRDREGDIELLARHFAGRFAEANRKRVAGITAQALEALNRYAWPGNVRELENVMERAVILMPGEHIDARELPERLLRAGGGAPSAPAGQPATGAAVPKPAADLAGESAVPPLPELEPGRLPTLEEVERAVILRTLRSCGGNKSEAARVLGITRKTLHARLNRYGAGDEPAGDAPETVPDGSAEIPETR